MFALRSPRRQRLLGQLAALAAAGAVAQRPAPIAVGVLRATPSGARDATYRLTAALKRRSYDEGRYPVIDARHADGRLERLPALARDPRIDRRVPRSVDGRQRRARRAATIRR